MQTARQFAIEKGISERTVRSWVSNLSDQEREARGIFKVGTAWGAPKEVWQSLADVERKTGPKPKG